MLVTFAVIEVSVSVEEILDQLDSMLVTFAIIEVSVCVEEILN